MVEPVEAQAEELSAESLRIASQLAEGYRVSPPVSYTHLDVYKRQGPPGSGKTMLAERLPSILPTLDNDAAMEVTAIRSLCSAGEHLSELVRQPPFEAPHHSACLLYTSRCV